MNDSVIGYLISEFLCGGALRSHIRSFGTLGKLLKIPRLSTQNLHCAGGRGGPRFILIGRAHARLRNHTTTPSGVLNNGMFMKVIFRFMKVISGAWRLYLAHEGYIPAPFKKFNKPKKRLNVRGGKKGGTKFSRNPLILTIIEDLSLDREKEFGQRKSV